MTVFDYVRYVVEVFNGGGWIATLRSPYLSECTARHYATLLRQNGKTKTRIVKVRGELLDEEGR